MSASDQKRTLSFHVLLPGRASAARGAVISGEVGQDLQARPWWVERHGQLAHHRVIAHQDRPPTYLTEGAVASLC